MAEYYAVERSSEYLAHFGIRGMKWGVRKQKPIGNGALKSKAYMDAKKKLQRATMVGGIIGGAIYAHRHKSELDQSFKKQKSIAKKAVKPSPSKRSASEERALQSFKKSTRRGAVAGALTVGGGIGGGSVGAIRYARQNPKQYQKVKKAYKKMSFKERMKYAYS